jgi:hypothetical protein
LANGYLMKRRTYGTPAPWSARSCALGQAVDATIRWYRGAADARNAGDSVAYLRALTSDQIAQYESAAARAGLPWAVPYRTLSQA